MYELFVIILGVWAGITIKTSFLEVLMLIAATTLLIWEMKLAKEYEITIARDVLLLFAVSMVLAYSYGSIKSIPTTLLAGSVMFLLMYFVGKSRFYHWRIVGFMAVCLIPILLIATRMFGTPVENTQSYIYIGSFLTLAWILLLLPFAIGFFLRSEIKLPCCKKSISLNHLVMILWMAVNAYISGVINSEYGTALVICGTTAIMFFIYGKYWIGKGVFCLLAFGAVSIVLKISLKVRIRFAIFENVKEALQMYKAEAEPVIRVLDTAPLYGLWGLGHGAFQIKTAINDYVISCLLMNYGIVFTVLVVCVLVVFIVKICLIKTKDAKDQVLVETYGAMLFVMAFLGIAGPINSFVLTGVGIPFLSVSGSINSCLLGGLGMVIALKEKGEVAYEKKLFG